MTLAGLTNWPQLGVTASSTASLSEVIEGEHSESPGKKPRPSGGLMEPTDQTEEIKTNSMQQSRVTANIYSQASAGLRAPPFPDPHFEEQKKHFSQGSQGDQGKHKHPPAPEEIRLEIQSILNETISKLTLC